MSSKEIESEDSARAARVLKRISEITVDEWDAKIAYYAAETARLELIEQNMMATEPEPRTRSIRQSKNASPTTTLLATPPVRKIKVAK